MKKLIIITGIISLAFVLSSCEKNLIEVPLNDTELKSGNPENKGFDKWGFNWNAHHFNGSLYNVLLGDHMYSWAPWYQSSPYAGDDNIFPPDGFEDWNDNLKGIISFFWGMRNINLTMHWNEALISSEGEYPETLDDWIGSDAWIIFHYSGVNENGKKWSQFQKMVAANHGDQFKKDDEWYPNGVWYNSEGEEIGIFNDWAQLILVEVVNIGEPPLPFNVIPSYKNTMRLGFGITKK